MSYQNNTMFRCKGHVVSVKRTLGFDSKHTWYWSRGRYVLVKAKPTLYMKKPPPNGSGLLKISNRISEEGKFQFFYNPNHIYSIVKLSKSRS